MAQSARVKWIETRISESFGLGDGVAGDFLQRRDVAADITGLLDGTGPSCVYIYYQPRDVRVEVCAGPQ